MAASLFLCCHQIHTKCFTQHMDTSIYEPPGQFMGRTHELRHTVSTWVDLGGAPCQQAGTGKVAESMPPDTIYKILIPESIIQKPIYKILGFFYKILVFFYKILIPESIFYKSAWGLLIPSQSVQNSHLCHWLQLLGSVCLLARCPSQIILWWSRFSNSACIAARRANAAATSHPSRSQQGWFTMPHPFADKVSTHHTMQVMVTLDVWAVGSIPLSRYPRRE